MVNYRGSQIMSFVGAAAELSSHNKLQEEKEEQQTVRKN